MKAKKILCVLLILLITLTTTSCNNIVATVENFIDPTKVYLSDNPDYGFTMVTPDDFNISKEYTYINSKYGYCSLSEKDKKLYDQLAEKSYIVADKADENDRYYLSKIVTDNTVTDVKFLQVLTAYLMDNPQQFWVNDYSTYMNVGDKRVFQCYSYVSASDVIDMQKAFLSKVTDIVNLLPENVKSEYERELYCHDYIVDNCIYQDDGDDWIKYSTYGAIINGYSVCTGYSQGMQLLLSCLGVDSALVTGEGQGEGHQWNIVNIEDNWYHVDPTWDDTDVNGLSDQNQYFAKYDYFNLTTQQISRDHTIANLYENMTEQDIATGGKGKYASLFNLFLPDCSSIDYNYFYYNSATITKIDGELEDNVTQKLIEAVNAQKPLFPIYIADSLDYDTAFNAMFYNEPYLFFSYVDYINMQGLSDNTLSADEYQIYKDNDIANIILISLTY